jgi:hypothetical protein
MYKMKTYQCPQAIALPLNLPAILRRLFFPALMMIFGWSASAQELVFINPVLESGADGADGAVYRFSKVNSKIDALVKINARSSSLVRLVNIDLPATGHAKAFQPQVTYNNHNTPDGISDWWMEFSISFVLTGTNNAAVVDSFRTTALDIDGNNDKINEWVAFYNNKTYMFENNTQLISSNIWDIINLVNTVVGRKYVGPIQNFRDVDTSATSVMVTNSYENTNNFRIRTGGHSTGASGAADRMYSFWFRSFSYRAPVEFTLPLVLLNFDATLNNKKVALNWVTGKEKELSHFVIERSTNGVNYSEVGMVFATGNSDVKVNYSFADAINSQASGVLYYRLKMVDTDGKIQRSQVRLIRLGEQKENMSIATYPNPVTSELRITIPSSWQNKTISFDLFNANGQLVKHVVNTRASQTEMINVSDLNAGVYVVKASNGNEAAVQRIVKGK